MTSYYDLSVFDPESDINVNYVYIQTYAPHDHDYWELFVPMNGVFRQVINGHQIELRQGDALLIRPEDVHSFDSDDKSAWHINIMFKREFMERTINSLSPSLMSQLKSYPYIDCQIDDINLKTILNYISLLNHDVQQFLNDSTLVANLLLLDVLRMVINHHKIIVSNKPEWLVELIRKINMSENMWWGVKDVVKEASFSHTHLNRKFGEYLNCSIVEYLAEVKINFAKSCLVHSHRSIGEISSLLGFKTPSHLNHIFKERVGISPLQYRKKMTRMQ